jgi:hypothetical protein
MEALIDVARHFTPTSDQMRNPWLIPSDLR